MIRHILLIIILTLIVGSASAETLLVRASITPEGSVTVEELRITPAREGIPDMETETPVVLSLLDTGGNLIRERTFYVGFDLHIDTFNDEPVPDGIINASLSRLISIEPHAAYLRAEVKDQIVLIDLIEASCAEPLLCGNCKDYLELNCEQDPPTPPPLDGDEAPNQRKTAWGPIATVLGILVIIIFMSVPRKRS
jgi:hypothetical protein